MNEISIGYDDDGIRLDRWFKRHRPEVNHGVLQKWLREGKVRLDGRKAEASARLVAGQTLRLPPADTAQPAPRPVVKTEDARRLKGWVIYEDANVIALNKPAGVAVQGGSKVRESIDGMLDALAKNGERPKLVHRLDRDTSGVLLIARSAKAAAELARAFASREAEKAYWALVVGVPRLNEGTIDLPLAKTAHGKSAFEKVRAGGDDGKRAVTDYRVVQKLGTRMAWLELYPRTGRTHQLRAHMLAVRHPILGDGKYGGAEAFPDGETLAPKLHLHARRITLEVFGRSLTVTAPLTGHMKDSFRELELDETLL